MEKGGRGGGRLDRAERRGWKPRDLENDCLRSEEKSPIDDGGRTGACADHQLRKGHKVPGVGSDVPDTTEVVAMHSVISDMPQASTGQDSKARVVALELRVER